MIEFLFSKQREIEGIVWTFAHLSQIRKMSSDVILPPFPRSLAQRLRMLQSARHDWEVKIAVPPGTMSDLLKEFSTICRPGEHQKTIRFVRRQWREIEKEFLRNIRSLVSTPIPKTRRCYITFYGGGGSFGRKNEIYVRVNPSISNDLRYANYTIVHEIIHLLMEPIARKKNLSPFARERLVDNIIEQPPLRRLFTRYSPAKGRAERTRVTKSSGRGA